jgi:hypothetical protein
LDFQTLGFPHRIFADFIHLFFLYFDIVLKFCIISYFLISTVSHAQLLSHPNIYFILPSKKWHFIYI